MHTASNEQGSPSDRAVWAAIVRVRSAIDQRDQVIQTMQGFLNDIRGSNGLLPFGAHAACYRHESIESDATLALLFEDWSDSDGARAMVEQIASVLKSLGQVDLSIWINAQIHEGNQ